MKAITITPLKKNSQRLIQVDKPTIKENEVLVKVLQAGVCRTDLEIVDGLYGQTPADSNYLIMGHESIGKIAEVGASVNSFNIGDLVVRTVRRPCPEKCLNCKNSQNDMCLTGNYTEIGIKGIHGIMSEYYAENPRWLVSVPKQHQNIGVLLEPLSFVEKVIDQTLKAQTRMYWDLKSAVVMGSGPIGILAAMVLRTMDVKTSVLARSRAGNLKSVIVEETGAKYYSTNKYGIEELVHRIGKTDLVIETTGYSPMVLEGLKFLNTNGVLCLTSITGDDRFRTIDISKININLVLNNNLILGVVNANYQNYVRGVERFSEFENRWPGLTRKLITKTVHCLDYQEAFQKNSDDIKKVIWF